LFCVCFLFLLLPPALRSCRCAPPGPAHPYQKDGLAAGSKNHFSGHVEDAHLNPYLFEEQYNSFNTTGLGHAPGGGGIIGTKSKKAEEAKELGLKK
jgi:hypothetical protein